MTDLLNADDSVLFDETTSVSFDDPMPDDEEGPRRLGKSKRNRSDLPQVVLGLALNRDGLPVRHWVFPDHTVDVTTVKGIVGDLLGRRPLRFLFIGDRGMVSKGNLDFLESRRLDYLLGSKLGDGAVVQEAVLSLRGRYGRVTEALAVKETHVTDGGLEVRYLLCRDTHSGGLKIDRAQVKADERFDGKYVLMTNKLDLDAGELVMGYREMWRVERAFRSMKSVLRIEPVHHRADRRTVAHAHLCVLAYLLIRIAENRRSDSWPL